MPPLPLYQTVFACDVTLGKGYCLDSNILECKRTFCIGAETLQYRISGNIGESKIWRIDSPEKLA